MPAHHPPRRVVVRAQGKVASGEWPVASGEWPLATGYAISRLEWPLPKTGNLRQS